MRARPLLLAALALGGALALAALAALAPPAAANPSCVPTPVGLACTFDNSGNGRPDRVFVYPTQETVLLLDVERRSTFTGAMAGTGAVPGGGRVVVAYEAHDRDSSQPLVRPGGLLASDTDGWPERRDLRADTFGPSNIGAIVAVTVWDRDSDGRPEAVDVWLFSTHYGDVRRSVLLA